MKRLVVLAALLMIAAVKAPPEWREDKGAGTQLAASAHAELEAKGVKAAATAQVFVAPDNSVLYVTLVARKMTADRDLHARELVDSFLRAPQRAQLTSAKVSVTSSSSKLDAAAKQIDAAVQWQNEEAGFEMRSRLVVVADAEHLITISGECLLKQDGAAGLRAPCDAALASLDPELPAASRIALSLAPEGTEAPAGERVGSGATLEGVDGPRAPVPPISLPAEPVRTVDRRPVYVGLGLVVLAGLFWWNGRRRDRRDGKKGIR